MADASRQWANRSNMELLAKVQTMIPAEILKQEDYASQKKITTIEALCQYLDRLSQNLNLHLSANNQNPWKLRLDVLLSQRTLDVQSKTLKRFWSSPSSNPANDILEDACVFIAHVSSHTPLTTTINLIMLTERVSSTTGLVVVRPDFPVDLPKSGALFRIKKLSDTLFEFWLPRCEQFVQHPPSDAIARKKRGNVLNEGLMAQVILQADKIGSWGNEEVRAARRMVASTSNILAAKIDETMEDSSEDGRLGEKRAHPDRYDMEEPPSKRLATVPPSTTEETEALLRTVITTKNTQLKRRLDKEKLMLEKEMLNQDSLDELRQETTVLTYLLYTRAGMTEEEVMLAIAQESEALIEG